MKLSNGILRPGKVLEVLENGEINASVPGLFSSEDSGKLPPIYPFTGWHANQFSSINIGDEIWVLNFSDNPMQLYWFRKDNYAENNQELMGEENVEILCNRESGLGWATIYFSDGSGWIIKNGDSFIQLDADGNITLAKPESHRKIIINDSGIKIGGEDDHPAVYGDALTDVLEKIQITLELVQKAASTNPFTLAIGTAIGDVPIELNQLIPKIMSPHVTLD